MRWGGTFDVAGKRIELEDKELQASAPNVWDDPDRAQSLMKRINILKFWINAYEKVSGKVEDVEVLSEFQKEGEASEAEVNTAFNNAVNEVEELEFKNMLSKEEDEMDAIMEINSGAGGTESQDWAEMLMRMYLMYAQKHDFKATVLSENAGDTAGIKSCTIEINGDFAYGYLKSESGVHRLVRISPFDSNARRHTSFASVFVYPKVDDSIEIEIHTNDIRWETFRASGAGGQHVNKTESAVRLYHEPSGLIVECQEERSQLKNRDRALKMMKSKLYQLELQKQEEEKNRIEGTKSKIEWGSQIRNYVFHPYKLVKDLRTSEETSNIQAVMDGDLDDFIKAYLMQTGAQKQD